MLQHVAKNKLVLTLWFESSNRKKDTSNIRQTEPSPIVFSTYTNYKLWTKKDLVILDKTIRPEKYHFDLGGV